ncbi:MAG: oxidoreductase [Candidatus Abawacabacteria bacterium]|nr:oxidoreductase [Candidatus Abawacabacteria bacterium]
MIFVDRLLNSITMYRVVLYSLTLLTGIAFLLSFLGYFLQLDWLSLPYSPGEMLLSLFALTIFVGGSNYLFSWLFKVPRNFESGAITLLILFFILAPSTNYFDLFSVALAGTVAMAAKYLLVIKNKHIFNPAALGLVVIGLIGSSSAVWWVGSAVLLPFVTILGLLVVRKVRRFAMFATFFVVSFVSLTMVGLVAGMPLADLAIQILASWPIIFFGTIMLTEPLTTPPTRRLQIIYAVIVGLLFASQFHIGSFYITPEWALVLGNIFSYLVSPKQRVLLYFKNKTQLAPSIYDLVFVPEEKIMYQPGQYMEWTISPAHADGRGNRRYFTLASAPTEAEIHLGIKVNPEGSSFKKDLQNMSAGETIIVSQLAGEFTMPADRNKKLLFIAGGIGITPFRSMIKYLLDNDQKRDVVLLYACSNEADFVYQDIFSQAEKALGIKTHCILSEVPSSAWPGKVGHINKRMLDELVPDFKERLIYISGPGGMVDAYRKLFKSLGAKKRQIKTDYFPGF